MARLKEGIRVDDRVGVDDGTAKTLEVKVTGEVATAASLDNAALGIDIGGTGVKAALVDVNTGELLSSRVRAATPQPSTPEAVAAVVRQVVGIVGQQRAFPDVLPIGAGLPGIIKDGRLLTAANIDKKWIGTSAEDVLGDALGRTVTAINDADAAAIAEVRLGAALRVPGTVVVLTIGTGIGSGLLVDGRLVPNTEFGHLEYKGKDVEVTLSGAARERRGLRWKAWAQEFNGFLARLELYFSPDLFILGGGVSKAMDRYREWLVSRAPIVPAKFRNSAGIIGAAVAAADAMQRLPSTTRAVQRATRPSSRPAASPRATKPDRRTTRKVAAIAKA